MDLLLATLLRLVLLRLVLLRLLLQDALGLPLHLEGTRVHVSGLLAADYIPAALSHWRAKNSLSNWLQEQQVPALWGIDTRSLTKHLREVSSNPTAPAALAAAAAVPAAAAAAAAVGAGSLLFWGERLNQRFGQQQQEEE